ncbi:MAG: AAA family ATPase [Thermomicrobiales bacterium]
MTWRVLLIGGSSGTGKTTVAHALARHYGVSLLLADDIRLAIQQTVTPAQHPAFHALTTPEAASRLPPEAVREALIAVSEAMAKALAIVIAHHVVVAGVGPVIIEGDTILPRTAVQRRFPDLRYFSGLVLTEEVRAIFLHEPDEAAILANMHERGRGFDALTEAEQQATVRASWLHGTWLREQCARYEVPVVLSRPRDTTIERALRAIDEASPHTG